MRVIPSLLWYFELTRGSGNNSRLVFTDNWKLIEVEGTGTPPVSYSSVELHDVEGDISANYSVQPRELTLGVFFNGARNQRAFFEGRRTLSNFVRPNQYKPVKLFVVLPSWEKVFIEVKPSLGAALPLTSNRGLTFLEPVGLRAENPIWQREENLSGSIVGLGNFNVIQAPNQAIVEISSEMGAVKDTSILVDLSVSASGGGGLHAGFYTEIKKASEADTEYVRVDTGGNSEQELTGLEDQTNYSIRAFAYNSGGIGGVSDVITQVTPQTIPPLSAPNLESSKTSTSVTLTWDAVTNATGYRLRYKRQTDINYTDWVSTTNTTHVFTGLDQQITYDFQSESSFTLDDMSTAYSTTSEISVTTDPYGAPGRPINLRSDGFTISWNPPRTGGPITRYRFQYTRGQFVINGTTSSTSVTVKRSSIGGSPETVRVRAEGPGGVSSYLII